MALKALAKGGRFDFIPDFEKEHIDLLKKKSEEEAQQYEAEKATRLYCRLLSAEEHAVLADLSRPRRVGDGWTIPRLGEAIIYACTFLIDWENVNGPDGPLAFVGRRDDGKVVGSTPMDIDSLPQSVREDIYAEVKRRGDVAELDFA